MPNFADNAKARFNYEILKHFSAGIELLGLEVKSIRKGRVNLVGAFVILRGNEAFLVGAEIAPYQTKNTPKNYDPRRIRKLLLSKNELAELQSAEITKGLTIIPLSLYSKGRFLKLDLVIARGRKKFDKRQAIKKRDVEREISRKL